MSKATLAVVIAGIILSTFSSQTVSAQQRFLLLDDFDNGLRNRMGGLRNTYENAPSRAKPIFVPEPRCGPQGTAMRLMVDRKELGYCGLWIHFFDMQAPLRRYIDATDYECLSFWVRGAAGGEKFKVKLADQYWIEKEDSIALGEIDDFLPNGVTTEWQEVVVELKGDHGLQLERLGGLTLDFDTPGTSTIFIDNIALKSNAKVAAAAAQQPVRLQPNQVVPADKLPPGSTERAIWLWTTVKMLDDTTEADAFLQFCQQQGIKHVWAQLPYDMQVKRRGRQVISATCAIRRESALRRFLQSAHAAGLKVHALEGYPEHAQRQYHYISLAIVDAVLAFNKDQPAEVQFDGIHFDNEPHLLIGWHDPQLRKQILFEFLSLNSECQRRVEAATPRIQFGVDIPFWWHHHDARLHETHGDVFFGSQRQSASLHLLEMLDNVGVMNYRDVAQGRDGMIAHGRDLLVHAEQSGKTEVFMGVETCPITSDQVLFAVGQPRDEFELAARGEGRDLAMLSRLDGHRIHVCDDGQNVHVGIQVTEPETNAKRVEIARTISKLADVFGLKSRPELPAVSFAQQELVQTLSRNAAWANVKPCSVRDPDSGTVYLLVKADAVVLGKTTFADENAEQFAAQLRIAEEQFQKHKSYAGIAIHHYGPFRDLIGRPANRHPELAHAGRVPILPVAGAQHAAANTLTSAK